MSGISDARFTLHDARRQTNLNRAATKRNTLQGEQLRFTVLRQWLAAFGARAMMVNFSETPFGLKRAY
jgi:hypothetical protein